jgi:SRSO17 transposase
MKSGFPTGLVVDETSHLMKRAKFVTVVRRYTVVAGKVDNCQVAAHISYLIPHTSLAIL